MAKKSFSSCLKSIDNFSTPLASDFKTVLGSIMSIIMWLIVGGYGLNKLIIMMNRDDTLFNEYSIKNDLTDEELSQEQLQFWMAFGAFDYTYDVAIESDVFTNVGFERYIEHRVALWTQ